MFEKKEIKLKELKRILKHELFYFVEGEKPENKQKRLEQKYASLQIVPNVERLGSAKVCLAFSTYENVIQRCQLYTLFFYFSKLLLLGKEIC